MASAQVLRKQEHLEAGKRKLEEFRKKKAAEKAKKTTTASQLRASDGSKPETQPSETEHVIRTEYNAQPERQTSEAERVIHTDTNHVGTSDVLTKDIAGDKTVPKLANKEFGISLKSDSSSTNSNAKTSISANHVDTNSSVQEHSYLKSEEYKRPDASVVLDRFRSSKANDESSTQFSSRVGNDHFWDHNVSSSGENHPSSNSSYLGLDSYPSNNTYGPQKDLQYNNAGESANFTRGILPQNSVNNLPPEKMGNSSQEDNRLTSLTYPDMGEKKFFGAIDHARTMNDSSTWASENRHADYDSDARSSSNQAPPSPPAGGRRSRPSFLDSINIPKVPSSSPSLFGASKNDSSSKVYPVDGLGSSVSQRSANSSVASGDGVDLFNHAMESKQDFFSQKQNEDFAALEQHIEDLTQEKFSLQRALEASRALAESLASENSTLTDSYNQQGAVVNQLRFDLEQLQEEINARLVELEAVKAEYANAQMECNAADERSKLLASEVIGLEEKALQLRSNELKLERQLENTQSEISSYRKKISSLERDRQDLQSTINALQEEKKLLQSKLRKASSSGKSIDADKESYTKKDVSTTTDDLDINTTRESASSENFSNAIIGDGASSSQFSHESKDFSLDDLPMAIPSDHLRTIQNIHTLLAELALEKEQLVQALSVESSQSSKLLEQNKELTRKLEAQTQRLELLTAKSMANDNIQSRQPDYQTVPETLTYADEGDEVVERVLGWIMKLFPGGSSSRRRPSKHL